MTRIRALSLMLALALGGCSVSEFVPKLTPDDIAGPQPQYRFLIAGRIKSIMGDPAGQELQISDARRTDSLKGPSWLVCLQVRPFSLALPRYYGVYIQQQKIVESRLSVLIDQCELQTYTPFDWAREAQGQAQ
jgi:hypothetical protein